MTIANAKSRVGLYLITVSGAASPDYVITALSGTLTIIPDDRTLRSCPADRILQVRTRFVSTLYYEMLARDAEPAELRFWVDRLAAGVPPRIVAIAIWRSREHRDLEEMHLVPVISFRLVEIDAFRAWKQAESCFALVRR